MDARMGAIEEQIRASLAARDLHGAATQGVRGYGQHILRYLRAVLQDEEAACEVFSQFSENLWKGIGSFRQGSSFRTWAYKLAWNAAIDFRRDGYRKRADRLLTGELSNIVEEIRTHTAPFLKTAARNQLARMKESLSPDDRSLLLLRVDKNLPWDEVAEVMSSEGEPLDAATVRKRYERLKARMRELAKREAPPRE
jgi:RNA polymerase sigma-70 factor (ECF subfamily)